MSPQATNSLALYKGGNPETIEKLLHIQQQSVVNELMEFCHSRTLSDLAIKLSLGAY